MKKLSSTLLLFGVLFSNHGLAISPELEIRDEAENISIAMASIPVASHAWHWDLIRVRLMLQGGVDIPIIAKFSLNPEIEFWFVKQ